MFCCSTTRIAATGTAGAGPSTEHTLLRRCVAHAVGSERRRGAVYWETVVKIEKYCNREVENCEQNFLSLLHCDELLCK